MTTRERGGEPRISVVVPVYNSAATLGDLVERLTQVLERIAGDFEIVLVDDGSRDDSGRVIEALAGANSRLQAIRLMRNYGQHNALLCGIRAARFELTVTLDDDLQNPPEDIPKLLEKLEEGFDVVYGTSVERQHGLWRNWASWVTKFALRAAVGAETAQWISPFRLFRTELREAFREYESSFVSIDVLLTWGTTRFAAVSVRHEARRIGGSNYTFWKLLTLAVNTATGFSTLPLQIASLLGFVATVLGGVLLVIVLVRYTYSSNRVPGFAFIASVILIFSGTQLFALGIIGEYLARMHFRMMGRPAYVRRSSSAWRGADDSGPALGSPAGRPPLEHETGSG